MNNLIDDDNDTLPNDFLQKARCAREVLEEDFGKKSADLLIKGKVGRPVSVSPKKQVTIRLDADVLEEFRLHKGWQTEINTILREHIEENRPSS